MAALTQPRFDFPYFGQRYGSFAGKRQTLPDFMHGTMDMRPYLAGDIVVRPHLSGKLNVSPYVVGTVIACAHTSGKLSVVPYLHGDIRTNP